MSEHSLESDTDASASSKRRGVSNADDKPVAVAGAPLPVQQGVANQRAKQRFIKCTDENLGAESFIDASDGNFSKRYAVAALLEQFAWAKTIGDINHRRMALEYMVSFLLDSELRAAKRIEHASALEAKENELAANQAKYTAGSAAKDLQSVCNLISAAPTVAHSTSSSRSASADATAAPLPLLATQQTDDDEDGVAPTKDQLEAAVAADRAAASRAGGTEFADFVGTWSMPSADDAAWRAAATEIAVKFEAMLSTKISGWKRDDNDTAQTRLDELTQFRAQGASARNAAKFPRQFETKLTHPFVFAVLNATKSPLAALLPAKTLHLYTENVGPIANKPTHRNNADAMLFGDAESRVSHLDSRARRDALVVIEAKRWLNKQGQADALVGGERDFVIVSGDAPSDMMRACTSVFADGVEWYFARIAWSFSDRGEWKRDIKISPKIDATAVDGRRLLARWFAFAFYEAVNRPNQPTGLRQITWQVGAVWWQLADVMSCGTRSIVSRWRQTRSSTVDRTIVVKFAVAGITEEINDKIRRYFACERNMLRQFAANASFVHIDALFPVVDGIYVALEDGGVALASFNIRGAAGHRLAKAVYQHIWLGALLALKEHNLSHFDITENNIVVSADRGGAKLIDLESVTCVGQSVAASPTAAINNGVRPAVASVSFDEQCVCAILQCLWVAEIASFEERASFVAQFGADVVRRGLVEQIRSAQV